MRSTRLLLFGGMCLMVAMLLGGRSRPDTSSVESDGVADLPGSVEITATEPGTRSISYSLAGEYRSRSRIKVDALDCQVTGPSGPVALTALAAEPAAQEGAERTWFRFATFPVAAGRTLVECRALPAALGNVPVRIGVGPGDGTVDDPWPIAAAVFALAGGACLVLAALTTSRRAALNNQGDS